MSVSQVKFKLKDNIINLFFQRTEVKQYHTAT